jgi:hypothetical protein
MKLIRICTYLHLLDLASVPEPVDALVAWKGFITGKLLDAVEPTI